MLSYRRTIGLSPCFYSNSCYFSFRNKNVPVQKHFNSIHSILSSSLLLESKTIQPKFYSTRSNNRRKFKKEYNFILKSFKFRERNYFNNHRTYSVLNQNNKIDFPGFKTIKRILLWFILLITGTSFILGTTWFLLDGLSSFFSSL